MSSRLLQLAGKACEDLHANAMCVIKPGAKKLFWYDKVLNFGDWLGPELLKHYGAPFVRSSQRVADVVLVGSVLHQFRPGYSGTILGAGLISDEPRAFSNARVLGLRGRLTLENLGLGGASEVTLGDPGLLSNRLLTDRPPRRYALGVTPHYTDKGDPAVARLVHENPEDVLAIDVMRSPEKVIRDIASCDAIASSSLHGLIVADSLGLPTAWLRLGDSLQGGDYKFRDYYSVYRDAMPEPLTPNDDLTLSGLLRRATARNADEVLASQDAIEKTILAWAGV